MPKLDITKDEQTIIDAALEQAITSAQRQQNAKKGAPMIKEVYATQERVLTALRLKVADAK